MSEPEKSADGTETWIVYRQDDHGNRFVVKSGLDQAQAEQLAREFESHPYPHFVWRFVFRSNSSAYRTMWLMSYQPRQITFQPGWPSAVRAR